MLCQSHKAHQLYYLVAAHERPVVDDEEVHPGAVSQSGEELRSEEEVLGARLVAGRPHQHVEHEPLVTGVHPLVDLVHAPAQLMVKSYIKLGKFPVLLLLVNRIFSSVSRSQ